MPSITPEFKEAMYLALAELGGEADTSQIYEKARTLSPMVSPLPSDRSICLRKLEADGRIVCMGRTEAKINGKGSTRLLWRLSVMPKPANTERLLFVRVPVAEMRESMKPETF